MPLCYSEEKSSYQLAVWKMDEGLEELLEQSSLSAPDLARLHSFTHQARKMEWICIRLLMKKLGHNISIGYHPSGKPFLENSPLHISISHTKEYAGLIISGDALVGIDLERIHPRIEKIAHKFVNEAEEKFLSGENRLEKLFVIWGVKEVLFKMHNTGELFFKDHLIVRQFDFSANGVVQAMVVKNGFRKNYKLFYLLQDNLLITYCAEGSRYIGK